MCLQHFLQGGQWCPQHRHPRCQGLQRRHRVPLISRTQQGGLPLAIGVGVNGLLSQKVDTLAQRQCVGQLFQLMAQGPIADQRELELRPEQRQGLQQQLRTLFGRQATDETQHLVLCCKRWWRCCFWWRRIVDDHLQLPGRHQAQQAFLRRVRGKHQRIGHPACPIQQPSAPARHRSCVEHLAQRPMHPDHTGPPCEQAQQHRPIRGQEIVGGDHQPGLSRQIEEGQKTWPLMPHRLHLHRPALCCKGRLQTAGDGVDASGTPLFGQDQHGACHGGVNARRARSIPCAGFWPGSANPWPDCNGSRNTGRS